MLSGAEYSGNRAPQLTDPNRIRQAALSIVDGRGTVLSMISADDRRAIFELMRQTPGCVVSTVNAAGQPESSFVLFTETEGLEVIFGTHPSRKLTNIRQNPNVAVTVQEGLRTIQLQGVAVELNGQEIGHYDSLYLTEHPYAAIHLEGSTLVKITPVWIRYSDYGVDPPRFVESRFNHQKPA